MRLALVVLLAAAPASAQSRRYPPGPMDEDRDAEARSKLWEQALTPDRAPYEQLVREARPIVEEPETSPSLPAAIEKLDRAIAKLPAAADAYTLRGEAYFKLARSSNRAEEWTKCADDLAAADARTADGVDRTQLHLWLGMCAARAGRLGLAEEVLATTASVASTRRGELYTRLGEVRIALGKLDEAIDALAVAVETGEYYPAIAHYLLAAAYDRSRRNTDAIGEIVKAVQIDGTLSFLANPQVPFIGPGEVDYLYGLTYAIAVPNTAQGLAQPEWALVYFRAFLKLAPQSPWRRRAEEHVRELAALDEPQYLVRSQSSTALIDIEQVRQAIRRQMPRMRACLAKQPQTVVHMWMTKDGPRTPPSNDRAKVIVPPDGERAEPAIDFSDATAADREAARTCIDKAARSISLPAPAEHDTFYIVQFYVISP